MHPPDPPPPPPPIPPALIAMLHGLVFLLTILLRGLYLAGITVISAVVYLRRAIVNFEADPSFWIALNDLRRGALDTVENLGAVGRSFVNSFRETPNGRTSTFTSTPSGMPAPVAAGEDMAPRLRNERMEIPASKASACSSVTSGFVNGRQPTRSRAGNAYYAIIVGRIPGVYGGWHLAGPQVTGIAEAIYSGFRTREEAEAAFAEALAAGYVRAISW